MKLENHELKKTFRQGTSSAETVEVVTFGGQDREGEVWGWGLLVVIIGFAIHLDIVYSDMYYIHRNKT